MRGEALLFWIHHLAGRDTVDTVSHDSIHFLIEYFVRNVNADLLIEFTLLVCSKVFPVYRSLSFI